MTFAELFERLTRANHLDAAKKAIVVLWWLDKESPGKAVSVYGLAKLMSEYRLGNPNRAALAKGLSSSSLTLKTKSGFVLKAGAGHEVTAWLSDVTKSTIPVIDHSAGFLPSDIWQNTRGYIQKVCLQLNGCFAYGFFDAAAVMLRRLIETLIIEVYEHLKRQDEIKNSQGNYFMLGDLVDAALGKNGLDLGREARTALTSVKKLGDRSAHNPRFNAVRPDLEGLKDDTRLVSDVLINLASLRRQ